MLPQCHTVVREVRVDGLIGRAVPLRHDRLQQAEQSDGRDDPHDRRGPAQRAEHHRLEQQ